MAPCPAGDPYQHQDEIGVADLEPAAGCWDPEHPASQQSSAEPAQLCSEQVTEPTGGSSPTSRGRDRPYDTEEAVAADPNMPAVNVHSSVAPVVRETTQDNIFCQGWISAAFWLSVILCLASLGCGVAFVLIGDASKEYSPHSGLCKEARLMADANATNCANTTDLELVASPDACPHRPKGCFYAIGQEGDFTVMFNDCPDAGSRNDGGRLICLGATLHHIEKCTWKTDDFDTLWFVGVMLLVSAILGPAVCAGVYVLISNLLKVRGALLLPLVHPSDGLQKSG
eukprot:TRINITY_DN39108_c0_g1_i5.p1 TRINITY_DN39108_c0_g1~~TRINITY_DN39108_c0_g1_i5.p1  ORF type:complete len:310 (+),score=33.98 TRINITY_DN39108_c0_g1_i5:80-931(+)